MAKFKLIVSDPETGKSQVAEVEGAKAHSLIGRKLGETVDGSIAELSGHKLKITGGSDKDGVPIRVDVQGGATVDAILSGGVGFHSHEKGSRRRKLVRGNTITDEIVQINMKIVEKPSQKKAERKPKKAEEEEAKPKTA